MARKDDYIPVNDLDLRDWLANMESYLSAHAAEFGITPGDVASLAADVAEFGDAVNDFRREQELMASASARKRSARAAVERRVRPIVRQVTGYQTVDNGVRSLLGLKPINNERVRREVGLESPCIALETTSGTVTVHFGTAPGNELRNGKPKWASGCNIYRKLLDEDEFRLVAFAKTSPYRDRIDVEATVATYIVQYVGLRKGQVGQSSSPTMIAAGSPMPKSRKKPLLKAA